MTLEEIAALAGVSRSTVSRVINNHPNVETETRERVNQVIREHDFHPNSAARTLVSRRSHIVGLVIPQALNNVFADPYFPTLIQGIASACDRRNYFLMLSLITTTRPDTYSRIIRGGHLDGLVVASALTDDSLVNRLGSEGFPFVLIGRSPRDCDITTVDVDNVRGASLATQHLARLGYTRIATITGPLDMVAAVDRRDGFLAGLRTAGLTWLPEYVVEGNFTEWSGFAAMQRLLSLPAEQTPQAVFAASDMMAVGALRAIRAAGKRVPDDIALVGYDDVPLAAAVEPPLTTVRQPIERLGFTAASALLDLLQSSVPASAENGGAGGARIPGRALQAGSPGLLSAGPRIILPTELVIRESCGQAHQYRKQKAVQTLNFNLGGGI